MTGDRCRIKCVAVWEKRGLVKRGLVAKLVIEKIDQQIIKDS